MTDQSKYARAIEAIRTQHFYHREWADAIKHIEEMPWGPMDLEGAIRAFKYNFSNWCWHVAKRVKGLTTLEFLCRKATRLLFTTISQKLET